MIIPQQFVQESRSHVHGKLIEQNYELYHEIFKNLTYCHAY